MTWLCSWYCTLHHVSQASLFGLEFECFYSIKTWTFNWISSPEWLPVRDSRLFIWYSVGTKVVELKYTESQTTGSSSQNMFLIVEHKLNSQRKKKSWGHDPFSIVWTEFGPAQICGGSSPPWIIPGSGACTTPGLITFYMEARSGVSLFTARPSEALNLTVPTKAEGPHGCLDVRAPGMQTSKG